ncbi:DUF4278 domain-containing protein [Leptothermofonsia sp. ETS-13]|uniref:arginine synthesis PII-interacting regulator PirA n=1 Tax=Leptothermofonsia sp. ETS-13 TaxID=3035696 RepID=UPI003BA2D842
MKLSYRGVNYEYQPLTLEVTENEILGKYRGVNWRCHTLNEMPVPQADRVLKYRGVAYHTNRNVETCQADSTQSARPRAIKPVAASAVVTRKAIEETHRENLRRNLERRLQAARERGDQNLVNLLEAESRQLLV